jgi:hypothetical protein
MIDMPVGKCDLSVTFMGYKSIIKQGVRVLVDLTTPVDFELNQQAVEIGQEIVVVASNPIVQLDQTESRVIFTADRLNDLPNITTVQSVLTNYPGVVVGRDDRLHVRGGRAGQVAYFRTRSTQPPAFASCRQHWRSCHLRPAATPLSMVKLSPVSSAPSPAMAVPCFTEA